MSVYFVYRSQYETPNLNQVKVFDDASVLAWFQRIWNLGDNFEDASECADTLLGFHVYGFDSIFRKIAEHQLKAPVNDSSLARLLEKHLYVEGELICSPHCIQVLTDDDELDVAYYIFDDVFLDENKGKAEFLLLDGFELPTEEKSESDVTEFDIRAALNFISTAGGGDGFLFFATMSEYGSGGNLTDIDGGWVIEGLRLPDLPEYLSAILSDRGEPGYAPVELLLLRSQLFSDGGNDTDAADSNLTALLSDPRNKGSWQKYLNSQPEPEKLKTRILENALKACMQFPVQNFDYGYDWNFASGKLISVGKDEVWEHLRMSLDASNEPLKSKLQVDTHVAQVSIHTDRWNLGNNSVDLYNRWILFDDIWARNYPELANSILSYATRWDALSATEQVD